jgi:aspartyl-tRNA(Asn)/glutamyl-tRNA(Gln) amidotransferase subunit A
VSIDLSKLSVRTIRDGLASKTWSAREITQASLDRIAATDESLHAFNQVTPELALAAADAVDARVAEIEAAGGDLAAELPPLAGVPTAFKDNMNLRGTRTTCSSKILSNYESVYDCTAVRRMLDAGAVPLGKCNMDEFAFGSSTENSATGPSHNPWDLDRVPGGSSGGSAVAVSSAQAVLSLGSDTGGSIRQPGALTGTVALKPTYGRVSRYGCVAFGSSLDQIGPFARNVEDAAHALKAMSGQDPMDATSMSNPVPDYAAAVRAAKVDGMKGLRVGIVRDMLDMDGLDGRIKRRTEEVVGIFAMLGAEVGEVDLPTSQHALSAYYIIGPAEASSNLARFDGVRYGVRATEAEDVMDLYLRSRAEGFGPESIRRIMLGTYALSAGYYDAYYGQAQRARTLIIREFAEAFENYDILVTPTSPEPAFKIGEKSADPLTMYLNDIFTIPVNLAGNCAMNVPMGMVKGLPVGVQLIANHFSEETLLGAAAILETEIGFDTTPPRAQ